MKRCAPVAIALLLWPATARAGDAATFAPPWFFRILAGMGSVPNLPLGDNTANMIGTVEVGGHQLSGAFASGLSFSTTADMLGGWIVIVPGVFGQLDITYLLLTGFWAEEPPPYFPVRLQIGSRLGMACSESFRTDATYAPPYRLYRPELGSYLDLDVRLPGGSQFLVFRAGVDTSINTETLYRWSGSVGLSSSWGK